MALGIVPDDLGDFFELGGVRQGAPAEFYDDHTIPPDQAAPVTVAFLSLVTAGITRLSY